MYESEGYLCYRCGNSTEELVTIDPDKGRINTGSVQLNYEKLIATNGVIDCTVTADDTINTGSTPVSYEI